MKMVVRETILMILAGIAIRLPATIALTTRRLENVIRSAAQ